MLRHRNRLPWFRVGNGRSLQARKAISVPITTAERLRQAIQTLVLGVMLALGAMPAAAAAAPATAAAPAQMAAEKVLHVEIPVPETTLDPEALQDLYSAELVSAVFEPLLTYDYLARPARLVPDVAAAMPEISADGKTWTFHLRQDVAFAPDPVFAGRRRVVQAADVAFTLRRLLDPAIHSPFSFLLEGKIVGLDAAVKRAREAHQPFDYTAPVAGLEVLDAFTLRVHLNAPDVNFGHALAQPNLGILAPEVVRAYGDQIGGHPVGTGPYRVTHWTRGAALTLEANPNYRDRRWDFDPGQDPAAQALAKEMHGKRIPAIGRVEVRVIPEQQSALLAFRSGALDVLYLQNKVAPVVLNGQGQLKPEYVRLGIRHEVITDPEILFNYLNPADPMVGGMDPAHIALRRAILMVQDDTAFIRVIRKGQAVHVPYPIPPGVVGHDPTYRSLLEYNPAQANRLLDAYGFRRGADGWRTQPDGGPLVVRYWRQSEGETREYEELYKRGLDQIHVRFEGHPVPFPDLLKAERGCQVTTRLGAWIADYPDGDDFMQLFYGPNAHANNLACFQNAEWDALYVQSTRLTPGPERDALYHRMARMLETLGVAKVSHTRLHHMLTQAFVQGYRKSLISGIAEWPYLDLR